MNWCFAKVNGRLAEVYFEDKGRSFKFLGHCYVKRADFKTKIERKQIEVDIKRCDLIYRNKKYKDRKSGKIIDRHDLNTLL